jgi:phage regulator Rha-like protein
MILAEATENQHTSIVRLIKSKRKRLERFGTLRFMDLKSKNSKGGRPVKCYLLNEPQATLLITFLNNSEKVDDFKTELVRQFFEMRKFIAERHTEVWLETRQTGKITRRELTDMIQQLIELYGMEKEVSESIDYKLERQLRRIENERE